MDGLWGFVVAKTNMARLFTSNQKKVGIKLSKKDRLYMKLVEIGYFSKNNLKFKPKTKQLSKKDRIMIKLFGDAK